MDRLCITARAAVIHSLPTTRTQGYPQHPKIAPAHAFTQVRLRSTASGKKRIPKSKTGIKGKEPGKATPDHRQAPDQAAVFTAHLIPALSPQKDIQYIQVNGNEFKSSRARCR